ncbi:MAG: DUF169 domain-containing protein, partial [Methanobacteriaceae archaeon]|nr:DUF169 domain-containing protein [Methanobacteriaceae archaeon]
MDRKEQSKILKEVLGLENEPVAVTFTIEKIKTVQGDKLPICEALRRSADGESFIIDEEASRCPGGTWHCGLMEPPTADGKRRIQRFLTKGEKLYHSVAAFERSQTINIPPPTGLADKILFSPLSEADLRPDVVIFLVNPEGGCRLMHLDCYWDGIPPRIEPSGALCHAVISYSVMTGQTNFSLGDWTA